MSQKTIRALATVVWEEIERNPEFAARVETALGNFAVEFKRRRAVEKAASSFSIVAIMQQGGAELVRQKAMKQNVEVLWAIIAANNLDPAGTLPRGAKKAPLVDVIMQGAENKKRRNKVFDY